MNNIGFRYLDAQYGPLFWNFGLIGISTTASVALIEGRQRDDRDAAVEFQLNHHFHGRVEDEPGALAGAARVGIHLENCTDMRFEDCRRIVQQHGYMFCMSVRPDSTAFPGKPWVFEIWDIRGFAQELTRSAAGRLPEGYAARPVRYLPRIFNAIGADGVEPDPFVKEAGRGYEEEEEVRLFWPTSTPPPSRMTVTSLPALQYVRLVSQP